MELPRFLTLSKSRRFLTLTKMSKTHRVVPPLREVKLKASVHISDDTLLEYQHDLRTNSTFFNIELTLNPAISNVSAFQQYFIVNGLRENFMLDLDYDNSIIEAATSDSGREKLLVAHAENACNEKISRELKIAEKLLTSDTTEFFTCVARKVDGLLEAVIDSDCIESGELPLTEKSHNVYLEWFTLIEPCIRDFVGKAGIDTRKFSIDSPFELIDLDKDRALGSLLGEIYEGRYPWVTYPIQTRKYHAGSTRVCLSAKISEERIKQCLALCAASFFVNLAKSPVGRKFQASTSDLQRKYIGRAREYCEIVESIRREESIAYARQARKSAEILVKKLGSEAERLRLAMGQGLNFLSVYYETLAFYLRGDIESSLQRGLKDLYRCQDVDVSSSISFSDDSFSEFEEVDAIGSPQLLTLRVSKIISEYFNTHPWLSELNVKNPELQMLAMPGSGRDDSDAENRSEYVLIKNYLDRQSKAGRSGMVIDIDKILLKQDKQDEMISLRRV